MGENIVIFPKTKPLGALELISLRNTEIGSLKVGLKKTKPDGTQQEADELARIYGELRKQLSVPRIERLCSRSEGEWDFDRNAVKILRKEGKFEVFGYFLNGDNYLEYYEALFLLELNRLDIFYSSMRMSIEQAYVLLLGERESTKYSKYLVYSMFSKVGYIVQRYQNLTFSAKEPTAEDCIWGILLKSIQNKPIPDRIRNSEHFIEIERSATAIRSQIINQDTQNRQNFKEDAEPQIISFESRVKMKQKRKADAAGTSSHYKRARYERDSLPAHKSFIDFLTQEGEYKKFEQNFQSFDIIALQPQFDYDDSESSCLEIQFDIYLHNEAFKKSEPKPPAFRVAILKKDQKFPNRSQISRCYQSQEYWVPVLVVSISESKHLQAFLYHFT